MYGFIHIKGLSMYELIKRVSGKRIHVTQPITIQHYGYVFQAWTYLFVIYPLKQSIHNVSIFVACIVDINHSIIEV